MFQRRHGSLLRWAFSLAFVLSACDDGATGSDDGGQTARDGGTGGDDFPLYVLHSAVESPDGRVNYFTLVPSLTERTTVDYTNSIEISGRPRLYAQPGLGFFAIGDGEDVSITRYDVGADGSIVEGDRISFQPYGVTSMGAQAVYFASETRAYYKDPTQARIIVWNPTDMEVIETIDLPASLIRENRIMSFGDWASRGNQAFFTVTHYSNTYDRVDPGTTLVRVDTTTNQVTITEDDRCRELGDNAEIDGSIYFFSGVINAFGHAVYPDDAGQENCILRIGPGSNTFDADYVGSIAPALPEDRSGVVVTATGTNLWAQVVDLTVAPTAPGTTYGEWYAQGWTWWRIPLDSTTGATQITTASGAYSSFAVAGEDFFLLAETEPDYSSTTLLDVSSGTPEPGITFPGFTLDVIRVR